MKIKIIKKWLNKLTQISFCLNMRIQVSLSRLIKCKGIKDITTQKLHDSIMAHDSIMEQSIDTDRPKVSFDFGAHIFKVPKKTIETPAHV